MEMDSSTLFVIIIVSIAIWCFILINIIEKGSRSKQIEQKLESQNLFLSQIVEHLKMQTLLLSNMAEKQGVSNESISNILKVESKPESNVIPIE